MARTIVKDIFVGDIGTHFIAEIINLVNSLPEAPLDVSSATEMKIVFIDPDGTEKEFDAAFVNDGSDGLIEYITVLQEGTSEAQDLHMDGAWEYYGWVKYTDGQRRTSSVKFNVYPGRQSELPTEE